MRRLPPGMSHRPNRRSSDAAWTYTNSGILMRPNATIFAFWSRASVFQCNDRPLIELNRATWGKKPVARSPQPEEPAPSPALHREARRDDVSLIPKQRASISRAFTWSYSALGNERYTMLQITGFFPLFSGTFFITTYKPITFIDQSGENLVSFCCEGSVDHTWSLPNGQMEANCSYCRIHLMRCSGFMSRK